MRLVLAPMAHSGIYARRTIDDLRRDSFSSDPFGHPAGTGFGSEQFGLAVSSGREGSFKIPPLGRLSAQLADTSLMK
jgi:hypothetical protein